MSSEKSAAEKFLAEVKARSSAATTGPWVKCAHGQIGLAGDTWWTVNRGVHDGRVVQALGQLARVMTINNGGDDAAFIAHARTDVDRLVAMVEAARKLSRGIAAEYADSTQGPSETLGKIAGRAEEYDAELDRIIEWIRTAP